MDDSKKTEAASSGIDEAEAMERDAEELGIVLSFDPTGNEIHDVVTHTANFLNRHKRLESLDKGFRGTRFAKWLRRWLGPGDHESWSIHENHIMNMAPSNKNGAIRGFKWSKVYLLEDSDRNIVACIRKEHDTYYPVIDTNI